MAVEIPIEGNVSCPEGIKPDSAKTLMAQGSLDLHDHVASHMTNAFGDHFPTMELRFKNVSISADVVVKDTSDAKTELPTLPNVVMKTIRGQLARRYKVKKQVLDNVSGVFKPGTMTLVLGQPGSGKSALMKLLSGRFPKDSSVKITGEVTYNGTPLPKLRKVLPQLVSYVPQLDEHYTFLTAKETLEFAHACSGGDLARYWEKLFVHGTPEENQEALKVVRAMYQHYPEVVIQQLGLDTCQNTIVGDAMHRGVSGGERKRVTTGEMAFGNAYVKMMDEISTGLDSAAAFDILTMQRSIAKKFHKTVVISLLQPSPEMFALFDNVILLNEGRVMYNGPCDEALDYFEALGFKRLPHRDVADFLIDLGTNKQVQHQVRGNVPRTPQEVGEAFETSSAYEHLQAELSVPNSTGDMARIMKIQPEFYQSFWASTILLMKRQITMMRREMSGLVGRLMMNTLLALLYGCVFYQIDPSDPQLVMGVIFESALCLSMALSAQIPSIMAARDVFYKQRGNNFFRTASYILSYSASQLPPIIFETVVFSSIVYWMCGFVSSVESFILFVVIICLVNFTSAAFVFFLASVAPNINVVNPIAGIAIELFILFAGFTITKDQIPDYLIWIYWINPVGWGVRALAVNQYTEARFDTCIYSDVDYCARYGMKMGEYALSSYEVPTQRYWIWYGMLYTVGAYFVYFSLSFLALEYYRYESPENVVIKKQEDIDSKTVDALKLGEYTLTQTPRNNADRGETTVSVDLSSDRSLVPVTVAFKDLWYTVPDPADSDKSIDLLKGISGYALPGTITALMGSSGAGKTTLMDVIAGRKTGGKIQGQILLNGHPATDLAIRRSTGYCEQMDIHSESSTFREALTFSAFLRQGADVPDSYKYDSVDMCLDLLDLTPIADQIIRGSSVEQMKRLTIGVELAAQPSVLFLDEPTSGLDARSAKLIMDGVRKVANTGRTIVCTIHQPSAEVFQVFDSMLLLKRGGETVYAGELGTNAQEMISYFESIDGVEKLKANYNPASWVLDVVGAGVSNNNGDKTDFVGIFKSSGTWEKLQSNLNLEGVSRPSPSIPSLEYADKRAATELTQMKILLERFSNLYWRTASFNLTRFGVSFVLGLLGGITYLDTDYNTYAGINSGMGMVFSVMGFVGFTCFTGMVPVAAAERAVFYRERASQTYNAFWYFCASSVIEIPYAMAAVMLCMVVFYPVVGFTGAGAFFTFYLILVLCVLFQSYLAELMVFLSPNMEVAEILGMVVNLITFLFSGYSPPAESIPQGVKWIYHINPLTYTLSALATVVFGDCSGDGDIGCNQVIGAPPLLPDDITVKEYLEINFGMYHDDIWRNCGIMVAFVLFVRILTILAMRFVNFQNK
ncbi:ABC transporter G family member 36 [Phytophthora citrophthora]|uniref:ABC transporter G family member 36 n=1 Tax=Phytophthora citrophthora TaxID=4793 RepID=A0AAD9GX76_9STRA|nr:ABC transporter G family member 36 [Phytophthora citrophthora]